VGVLLAVGAGSLALAAGAAATKPSLDKEQVRLTSSGQAAARAVVVTKSDLGTSATWNGGAVKPSPPSAPPCATYHPKQSDLTLIGQAETKWAASGLQIDSEADVLRTPAMVRLDWQRTVLAPQMTPCIRAALTTQFTGGNRLVSFGQVGFPRVATYARAYRAIVSVANGSSSVPVLLDLVLVGRGRTEITLTVIAPDGARASISAAEVRLARLMISRVRA
jgi:hypothetical protein